MKKPPCTAPSQRLYAIGDIHGRLDLLTRLLAMIEQDASRHEQKDKKLIFLGDYIDRGLDSRGVIERLSNPFAAGLTPVFIRGNHDNMLLQFLAGDMAIVRGWLQLGGSSTIASYGVNPFTARSGSDPAKLREDLLKKIPHEHRGFLDNTVYNVTYGDYTFVHAGLRPQIPMSAQSNEDKMWIRGDFLFSDFEFDTMIVHGHTIKTEPEIRPNRIGIDTGAFATGKLTCLICDGQDRQFFST